MKAKKETKGGRRRKRTIEGSIREADERNREMKQGKRDCEKMGMGRKVNEEYYAGEENKKGGEMRGKEEKQEGEKKVRRGR